MNHMYYNFKTKSAFHHLRMLAYICAAASHCIAVNMAVESPMLVATSSRASGQVGSRLVVGSRVIGVSVSWYQL
jgi:hypothetical protein